MSSTPDPDLLRPLPTELRQCEVLVIGAGLIGLSTALRLAQDGHRVTLLEREDIAAGASRGNAGAYAFSDIQPLASPGILAQAPRWLLDPLGPLALRPRYLPRMLPWLWQFWRASQPAAVAASTRAQAALMQRSAQATHRLLAAIGAESMLHNDGNLHLYDTQAQWQASLPGWAVRAQHGVTFEHVQGAQAIAHWQPGVADCFAAATFVPGWSTIDDPWRLALRLAQACWQRGANLHRANVQHLQPQPEGVQVGLAGGAHLMARQVVLCAGPWSHRLARTLGDALPLEAERGYNHTLPPGAFDLKRQLTFPAHGFVVTPIAGGVRVGGAVEFAGVDALPNYRRADALLAKAQRFLPGLHTQGARPWMGCRPSLPDSLPALGASPCDARVIYAFGHGHLGLTQSAATAEIVAALLAGRAPGLDLRPFDPRRFSAR